ncbi:hypothetical protein NY2A_b733R [Paramecium bursaria Chlorella virus NY2A]|uniref:Uncharacterized protein b733R n=1 Tax=Paramecium bursaria Chlorella virus NY2A TaxID=46021 RepID=A7IXQ8_PBCVN|nr:hypothetical protein NY2A_b733R [Paramecium bursaria Chlorella virus NY2A]ABT15132.1 hypothetical protein NY2A_b733R [Paramecium bursaria Chlorella virus NY2A]
MKCGLVEDYRHPCLRTYNLENSSTVAFYHVIILLFIRLNEFPYMIVQHFFGCVASFADTSSVDTNK